MEKTKQDKGGTPTESRCWRSRFDWRMTSSVLKLTLQPFVMQILLFLLMLAVSGTLLMRHLAYRVEQAAAVDIPAEVARRLPPLSQLRQESAAPEVLRQLNLVNPDLEAYIIDRDGVFAYPPDLRSARLPSMEAIHTMVGDELPSFPLFGPDPRRPGEQVLFLAAPLVHGEPGYVYLVLHSRLLESTRNVAGWLSSALLLLLRFLPCAAIIVGASIAFTLHVTSDFRQILFLIRSYAKGNLSVQWISRHKGIRGKREVDIDQLGRTIDGVARIALEKQKFAAHREERRRRLLLDVVHDVRGPLSGMRAALETMLRKLTAPKEGLSPQLTKTLELGIRSIARLSGALREASRADFHSDKIQLGPVDLSEAASAVVVQLESKAESSGIKLQLSIDPEISIVLADRAAIDRILLNLVDNAIRYSPQGGVVQILLQAVPNGVSITIQDIGRGISAADLPHVFEAFYRASECKITEGAGIGLAIVKRLVELHGSSIAVTSEPQRGSSFCFELRNSTASAGDSAALDREARVAGKSDAEKSRQTRFSITPLTAGLSAALCTPLLLLPHYETSAVFIASGFLLFLGGIAFRLVRPRQSAGRQTSMQIFESSSPFFLFGGLIYAFLIQSMNQEVISVIGSAGFIFGGFWAGIVLFCPYGILTRLLAIFPLAATVIYWLNGRDHTFLSLPLSVGGIVMGIVHVLSQSASRLFLRTAVTSLILSVPAVGFACFVAHATWEDELRRPAVEHESQFADSLAAELTSIFRRVREVDSSKQTEMLNDSLLGLRTLTHKTEFYLATAAMPSWINNVYYPDASLYRFWKLQEDDGIRVGDSVAGPDNTTENWDFFSRVLYHGRRIPIFIQRVVSEWNEPVKFTLAFNTLQLNAAFIRVVHVYDVAFLIIAACLTMLVGLIGFSSSSRPYEQVLSGIRRVLRVFVQGKDIHGTAAEVSGAARPIVDALVTFMDRVKDLQQEAERADADLANLAWLAGQEYEHFVDLSGQILTRIAQVSAEQDSVQSLSQIKELLHSLEDLVEPELSLTQALFVLAQTQHRELSVRRDQVDLREAINEISSELLGICILRQVIIDAEMPEELLVETDTETLKLLLLAALDGLIKSAGPGQKVSISAIRRHADVILQLETSGSPTAGTQLGETVATELSQLLDVRIERAKPSADKALTTISLPYSGSLQTGDLL